MTCREKLKMEHPEYVIHNYISDKESIGILGTRYAGGCKGCPSNYGYMADPDWCDGTSSRCTECWDRKIPDNPLEHESFQPLGESLVEGFQSSVNHSEKSRENSLTMCFSELIDAVSQCKVIVQYDAKDEVFKILPAKIVRRDEELDKR